MIKKICSSFVIASILFFLVIPFFTYASSTSTTSAGGFGTYTDPFFNCKGTGSLKCFTDGAYAKALTGIGVLATIIIVFSGILYMTSGGNPERQGKAKKFIFGALSGVALLILSYTIIGLLEDFFGAYL